MRSSVRCGREVWPPLPVSSTSSESAAPVSGPSRRPDRADVEARVAVQPEDPGDAVERAGVDRHQGAAGHDLLGGLEEQPDPAGQSRRRSDGERQAGSRAARRCARRGRRRGRRPARCWPTGPRCGPRPGARRGRRAARPPARARSRCPRPARCAAGAAAPARPRRAAWRPPTGPLLRPGQLGVGVQVTPELDQLVGVAARSRPGHGR